MNNSRATVQASGKAPGSRVVGVGQIERKYSNCDMPRQMPSEIDRQIREATESNQRNRLLEIPNFESAAQRGS